MMEAFGIYLHKVIESLDWDFHDASLDWIYNEDDISDEVESLVRILHIADTPVPFAKMYLQMYREDFLDRNYDGPQDGEAWSGGFADNH